MPHPTACTIVSNNYLPFARVFARSFREHNPDGEVHVLVVDRRSAKLDYETEPFLVTFADELKIPAFPSFAFRYSILELNTAVKPFFLEALHRRHGLDSVCYFDPDILVTSHLGELYELLDDADVVLTPHILEPVRDSCSPGERDFLLSGAYNLGFLGISYHHETLAFLSWWQERLYSECLHRVEEGLFVDQKWMDLAPAFLDRARILRDPAYNAAYWNLVHHHLSCCNGDWLVGSSPLRFFHFSGFDPLQPEKISKYQNRYVLQDRPDVFPLFKRYQELLFQEGYAELRDLPYGYATFLNGEPIPFFARYALERCDRDGKRFPDPFAVGPGSFYEWLREPLPQRSIHVPRWAEFLREERSDLQQAFPDLQASGLVAFARWLVEAGQRGESDLSEGLVAAIEESLREGEAQRQALLAEEPRHFTNGVQVPPVAGRILGRHDPEGELWPAPLVVDHGGSFYSWLLEPGTPDLPVFLPRLAMLMWEDRSDLRKAFPQPEGEDLVRFATWLLEHGRSEMGLAEIFVTGTRVGLELYHRRRVEPLLLHGARRHDDARRTLNGIADVDWLVAEAREGPVAPGEPLISHLALMIYRQRQDLQRAFPDPLGASRHPFAYWFLTDGRLEYGLGERFLEPVRRRLSRRKRLSAALWPWQLRVRTALGRAAPAVTDPPPAAAAPWREAVNEELAELHETWEALAASNPLAASLSPEAIEPPPSLQEFFQSGEREIVGVFEELEEPAVERARTAALDFGCGAGRLTRALARRFQRAVGVDISESMIAFAQEHSREPNVAYRLHQRDDLSLFPDNSFTFVYSTRALQHIQPQTSREYIREFFRVLTPGGVTVFQVPSGARGGDRANALGKSTDLETLIEEAGGELLKRVDDDLAGPEWLSHTYFARKNPRQWPYLQQHPQQAPLRGWQPPANRDWQDLLAPQEGLEPLNRYCYILWIGSAYLQWILPLDTPGDRLRFAAWLHLYHQRSLDLQSWLLPSFTWGWFDEPSPEIEGEERGSLSNFLHLVWRLRPDLQKDFPLTSPEGRQGLLQWAAVALEREYAEDRAIIEERIREAAATGVAGERSSVPAPVGGSEIGINVVEHPNATLGIREDSRMSALAFEAARVPYTRALIRNMETAPPDQATRQLRHGVNLIHCNADSMALVFGQLGPQVFGGRYNIAYSLWELPHCPPQWTPAFSFVDEVWVPSRFVYECFARVSPVPVVQLPYAVTAEPDTSLSRRDFGLPNKPFLFLMSFDASSYMARKNPWAAVEAFHRAFDRDRHDVGLVIKCANLDETNPQWQKLRKLAGEDLRIHLSNELLARERLLALVQLCDAYLSLHRSEGFGRGPAEAMLLGRPVVVTNFSGSCEFATSETACLVDAELVPVAADEYPFPEGQVWAEPDVEQAAWHMRRLLDDATARQRMVAAARRKIRSTYNSRVVGERYRERLRSLGLL